MFQHSTKADLHNITLTVTVWCRMWRCGVVVASLLNMNLINEILLSVLYFSIYDCAYTDFVLSGCFVIFKILLSFILYDFSVLYSCTAVNMCD